MSTKTTFKRIALVAVAALGLGVLTSAPSQAADSSTTTSTFTSSLAFAHTSATVVGATNANTSSAIFKMTAIGNNGQSSQLFNTGPGETITATVTGLPAASVVNATPAAADLLITPVKVSGSTYVSAASGLTTAANGSATISSATASVGSPDSARIAAGSVGTNPNSVYYFAVSPADAGAVDAGTYTIRIRLTDNTGFTTTYSVTVNFVASAADSGAVLEPTITGRYLQGDTSISYTATRRMQVTLKNATGGRVFAAGAAFTPAAPDLSVALTTSAGVARAESLTATDNGAATVDRVAITGDDIVYKSGAGADITVTTATRNTNDILNRAIDGTYGINSSSTLAAPTATGDLLRVRYGSTSATTPLTIVPTPVGNTTGTATFTATGKIDGTNATTLPLTTTSVTFNYTVTETGTTTIRTGYDVYYTLSYTNCPVTADQSPLATTAPVKLITDSKGQASVTVTSRKTVDGCKANVTWSGTTAAPAMQVATWAKPVAAASLASTGSYQALAKSAHTITWTVTDQFGAPFANEAVTFTASGANIPTAGLASSVTDANGQVTFAWTDAAGVPASTTLGNTSIRLGTVGGAAPTTNAAAVVVTYMATLDVVASLRATYTDGANQVLVPTTNIGGVAGRAVSAADQIDTTKVVTGGTPAGDHWVQLSFTALNSALTAVTGVPTTVTVTGAQVIGSNGKLGNSVVLYSNNAVWVLGTKTGVATVTATNGALTSTAKINFANAVGDARVLSLTQGNGLVTATVADAFGNGVSGVTVDVTGTGGAWFGNGATSASFKTATDGTVTFAITGAGTVTASLAAAAKSGFLADSGNALGTVVTTGAPAGVDEASIVTTNEAALAAAKAAADKAAADKAATDAAIAALKAQLDAAAVKAAADKAASDAAIAAAQAAAVEAATAAADAAAEATDAANAATDAANASAEAGDAATAAAQDAADAVAALSTQVSEMIDTLKKQITALTNLVIKIQKKVKA